MPNIRSVLEYVPYFSGKLFVIHLESSLIAVDELVDTLLDIDVLSDLGVKPVIVVAGQDASELFRQTLVCEMRTAIVHEPLSGGDPVFERVKTIVERMQIPVVASGVEDLLDAYTSRLAIYLGAAKFIELLDEDKVPMRNGAPIPAVLEKNVELLGKEVSHKHLLRRSAEICREGINRVHLLDGRVRGVLSAEIFSEEGVGTMVHTDSYKEIRPLKEEDIPELLSMIARSVVTDKLVERTYEDILDKLDSYYVLTLDESIIGSVALYTYSERESAELACLYIKHSHEGRGYGRELCAFVEAKAQEIGLKFIFALSKSAVYYFRDRLHYDEYPRDVLPPQRLESLIKSGRTSGVFGRYLS